MSSTTLAGYASPSVARSYAPTLPAPPSIASPGSQQVKRTIDVILGGLGALIALPFAAVVAAAIFAESGGPVLFRHERVGLGGRRFRIYKFRSMIVEGDEILARHLAENPEAAAEWNATHKLKRDPRITTTGRFLRRTSLDELPQIWNVLRGDMSLAGPRPIVETEIRHYGEAFQLYTSTRPGLTGLWQVSGRNDTSYRQRVELDSEYVRNWTPFLDLKVLLKTVRVVLVGKGAY